MDIQALVDTIDGSFPKLAVDARTGRRFSGDALRERGPDHSLLRAVGS